MLSGERVREALRQVLDPELGIDVVELGLVYEVAVRDRDVRVVMTMTSPACPLHGVLTAAAEAAIREHDPDVRRVEIEMVWEPPWSPDMMSEAARRRLGWEG